MRISDWSSDVCSSDLVNEYIGLRARREQGASAFCGTDVALHALDLPTEHAQRVQSPIEPSSVSPVNVDSHTLSNYSLSALAPQAPCRPAAECRAARSAQVHQFTTFAYMDLNQLPLAQLKNRLGTQKTRSAKHRVRKSGD